MATISHGTLYPKCAIRVPHDSMLCDDMRVTSKPMTLVEACREFISQWWIIPPVTPIEQRNAAAMRHKGDQFSMAVVNLIEVLEREESNLAAQRATPKVVHPLQADLDRLVAEARAMAQRKTGLDEAQRRLGIRHKRYVTGDWNSDWDD